MNIINLIKKILPAVNNPKNFGYCLICEQKTLFVEYDNWLRDNYRCIRCQSIPRNRALIRTLQLFAPDYKNLLIHESSPGNASSQYLKRNSKHYSCSHFFPEIETGTTHQGFRCENLECLTFSDSSFDIFVTADVFEHIMFPDRAFSEIARVLKPGGMHVFTIPWYPELKTSRQRAILANGKIEHKEKADFHCNPVDKQGSLVTFDWGLDFTEYIYLNSGMTTTIYKEVNRSLGLDGTLLEVFVSRKLDVSN
jgi:SAM-dependent methyltransferase